MTQHTESIPSGFITYSTVDKEFQFKGVTTYMEVHNYCGPSFYTLDDNEYEVWLEPDDSPEWNTLWKVYEDWHTETKGTPCPSHQNKNTGSLPVLPTKEDKRIVALDLWKLDYAHILVEKCLFPLQEALSNAECALENIEYDIAEYTAEECACEEISYMTSDC